MSDLKPIDLKPIRIPKTHYKLGNACYDSGKYQEAIESYKQAIGIDPDFALAHGGLGDAYYKSGMYEEAIKSYKQAIWIEPDYALAHDNLKAIQEKC